MKKTDTKTNVLLTDDPALVKAAAAQNRPVVYYERPGAEAVYEADYTVRAWMSWTNSFFRGSMNGIMGFPGASGRRSS